jgi:hypothetical protein
LILGDCDSDFAGRKQKSNIFPQISIRGRRGETPLYRGTRQALGPISASASAVPGESLGLVAVPGGASASESPSSQFLARASSADPDRGRSGGAGNLDPAIQNLTTTRFAATTGGPKDTRPRVACATAQIEEFKPAQGERARSLAVASTLS